jgi:hypothetical protein
MDSRLSPQQRRIRQAVEAPWQHALDRLRERHMADATLETLRVLATCANLACQLGGRSQTSRVVARENNESWIVEVDAFEDRRKILVVMNPQTGIPRTVLP